MRKPGGGFQYLPSSFSISCFSFISRQFFQFSISLMAAAAQPRKSRVGHQATLNEIRNTTYITRQQSMLAARRKTWDKILSSQSFQVRSGRGDFSQSRQATKNFLAFFSADLYRSGDVGAGASI
jgi:hypothetical protein